MAKEELRPWIPGVVTERKASVDGWMDGWNRADLRNGLAGWLAGTVHWQLREYKRIDY